MSTDFAPVFEKKFHEKVVTLCKIKKNFSYGSEYYIKQKCHSQIVPGLLMLLDDNDNCRVQSHAAAALVNFCEDCPKMILVKYLDDLMNKLDSILSAKFKEVGELRLSGLLRRNITAFLLLNGDCTGALTSVSPVPTRALFVLSLLSIQNKVH